MGNLEEIKKRFLKNSLSVRLGCIASDLARISSFISIRNSQQVVNDIIEESKFFIEWTAPNASLDIQEQLVNLQVKLALLKGSKKTEIAKLTENWSNKILKLSGLAK